MSNIMITIRGKCVFITWDGRVVIIVDDKLFLLLESFLLMANLAAKMTFDWLDKLKIESEFGRFAPKLLFIHPVINICKTTQLVYFLKTSFTQIIVHWLGTT